MYNCYQRIFISCLALTLLCVCNDTVLAQHRAITGAEAAYLQAQQGKPLPQKPGSPGAQQPAWTPPASSYTLRPSKIMCDDPKREVSALMYYPVLMMDESALNPERVASKACEEIVARIWNTYVRNNVCKPAFGPGRMNSMAKDFVELTVMAGMCRQPNPPKTIEELFIQNIDNQWNCFLDDTCVAKPRK